MLGRTYLLPDEGPDGLPEPSLGLCLLTRHNPTCLIDEDEEDSLDEDSDEDEVSSLS